jgi:hypothetical protein
MTHAQHEPPRPRGRSRPPGAAASLLAVLFLACAEPDLAEDELPGPDPSAQSAPTDTLSEVLRRALARADTVEELLFPAPLMTPQEEAALRTASNDAQLARARQLGVRVTDQATLDRLVAERRLVRLEDETQLWTTRRLRSSVPYVTPDARALLVRIGERFQQKLEAMGLPRLRVEVTSVLRTPENQAALRETNPNAASGVSTHEFGTTFDIAYSGYAAPGLPSGTATESAADRVAAIALERVAARYSRELQKLLGDVLRELQSEGVVMVTLERQQPVFHLTIARALAGRQ